MPIENTWEGLSCESSPQDPESRACAIPHRHEYPWLSAKADGEWLRNLICLKRSLLGQSRRFRFMTLTGNVSRSVSMPNFSAWSTDLVSSVSPAPAVGEQGGPAPFTSPSARFACLSRDSEQHIPRPAVGQFCHLLTFLRISLFLEFVLSPSNPTLLETPRCVRSAHGIKWANPDMSSASSRGCAGPAALGGRCWGHVTVRFRLLYRKKQVRIFFPNSYARKCVVFPDKVTFLLFSFYCLLRNEGSSLASKHTSWSAIGSFVLCVLTLPQFAHFCTKASLSLSWGLWGIQWVRSCEAPRTEPRL